MFSGRFLPRSAMFTILTILVFYDLFQVIENRTCTGLVISELPLKKKLIWI